MNKLTFYLYITGWISLQALLRAKEETVQKLQGLLAQTRQELEQQSREHEEELKIIQSKLHQHTDLAFSRFKQNVHDSLHQPTQSTISAEQVC